MNSDEFIPLISNISLGIDSWEHKIIAVEHTFLSSVTNRRSLQNKYRIIKIAHTKTRASYALLYFIFTLAAIHGFARIGDSNNAT